MAENGARELALAKLANFEVEATSLVAYQSSGRVIAVGPDDALELCAQLPDSINLTRLSTGATASPPQIDGYLGNFTIATGDDTTPQHRCDAVLDLHDTPLLSSEMLPPGYFHVAPSDFDTSGIDEALAAISGEFRKPKYFDYDPSICAHGVNGKTVCRRCIDACPADAIASIGERIEVVPQLCQGGGTCSTVCPSGAIRYVYPSLRDNGARLRAMLSTWHENSETRPIVMFHAEGDDPANYRDSFETLLPFAVEELGSVGMDLCLSALASGAAQVVLLAGESVPKRTLAAIDAEVAWARELLTGIGFDAACIAICAAQAGFDTVAAPIEIEFSPIDVPGAKRDALYRAIDHLVAQGAPASDRIAFESEAPFGEAIVDAGKCTLCMACVGACPGKALQDGTNREVPELFFVESNCLQCGACVQTCPEDAITLQRRYLFDPEARNRSRDLNRDQPFACIACGKPFAPTSVIHKMQEKLKGHYMFGNARALDRLKMCDDCRVVDIVQDPEAMGGQFDPLKGFKQ